MPQFDFLIIPPIFNVLIPIFLFYYRFFFNIFVKDFRIMKFRKKILKLFKLNTNIKSSVSLTILLKFNI